jgi:predicted dehydrogenase
MSMIAANERPIRIAFVGAGAMGHEHANAFSAISGVTLVGVHNRTSAKAEAFARDHRGAIVCDTIAELFERTRADLVIVAVPEMAIAPVIGECLRFPWAILMEKPVGYDLADGEAIEAAATAARASVMVGLNRRFLASTQAALADLGSDDAPRFIHVQDQQSLDTARAIGHPEAVVRNWMYANSIHLVDYLIAFGRGEVTAVERILPWNHDTPAVVLATVKFSSGDFGLYEGIWHGPGPWACTITTARRRWEMRPLEKALFQNAGERTLNPVEHHARDAEFKPGFRLQADHVIARLRGLPSDIPDLAEAMRSMRLVHRLFTPKALTPP